MAKAWKVEGGVMWGEAAYRAIEERKRAERARELADKFIQAFKDEVRLLRPDVRCLVEDYLMRRYGPKPWPQREFEDERRNLEWLKNEAMRNSLGAVGCSQGAFIPSMLGTGSLR